MEERCLSNKGLGIFYRLYYLSGYEIQLAKSRHSKDDIISINFSFKTEINKNY